MSGALVLGCLWVVAATVIALMPQRFHWPGAAGLIALGIPLLGWITWQAGPLVGLIALAAAMSVLRWPVLRAGQWLAGRMRAARMREE
ncbi:MAG: DUF2484 family protein [Rhodobacteraceae bacterium]|nr:DUF2484 family protein [Paracoccaceae bacterium]